MIDFSEWTASSTAMWPRLRQAIQTTVAASVSYGLVFVFGLTQGFWAVMTSIIVTQANVGASLGLAADRLVGSLLGVLVGGGVAVALADVPQWKFAGLAITVLVLAFFSARRPSLRIACVTAAIVILGDPRFGPPITSAWHRMVEVTLGTVVAIATTLLVFPNRAGAAFAAHITATLQPLLELLDRILAAALGQRLDAETVAASAARIRTALATGESLAKETRMEVAGYLAEHPDPDAILRDVRRLWHTEIMLLRAVSEPLPEQVVTAIGPALEVLRAKLNEVAVQFTAPAADYPAPDLSSVEVAFAEIEHTIEEMRAEGATRSLSTDDVIRLMAFEFALEQLRINLRDLAERVQTLRAFSGASFPLLRSLRAKAGWAK